MDGPMPIKILNILKSKKGFTLLEVLVAGAILSVGLLGVAGMMATAINANNFARKTSTAQLLAEQRIEKFRNLNVFAYNPFTSASIQADPEYCVPSTGVEDYGTITFVGNCATVNSQYTAFRRVTTAAIINNSMVSINVQVLWKDAAQKVHSVSLSTLLTQ